VALCDRLGGSTENACTIHSAFHRQKGNAIRMRYNALKEILILDEVYNADDWTFEKALAMAPEASRIVMVGDPDQIRPIPDEKGAGTPALDIACAFPRHVIFLDENMRQLQEARAIHEVVVAVRKKAPRAIHWQSLDAVRASAVLIKHPPPDGNAFKSAMFSMFERLRKDIRGDEHAWQIVTFFNGHKPDTQVTESICFSECD
jgi:AAA domain-containing protein